MSAGRPEQEEEPLSLAVEEAAAATPAFVVGRENRLPPVIRALHNPNFRLFFGGNFLSNIGTWMQNVAQGWLVLTLSNNSAFWLGVVGFAGSIPFLVFTLFGGVMADRADKRKLLIRTQSAMMVLAFALAAMVWFKVISVWGVAVIAFLNGMAQAMNTPAYQALVPKLVDREDLTNAIALNSAQFNLSRILGPTLGGYAMALIGVGGNFFLNGVSFLAVLWALTRMHFPEEPKAHHASFLDSLRDGFSYLNENRQMLMLIWLSAIASLFALPFFTFIPYFARMQLNADEAGLGWLMACSGTGAVMAAVIVAALGKMRHRGAVATFCGCVLFATIIGFCYSHIFALSQCLLVIEGFAGILMISAFNVSFQHLSSDAMRGRTMSIYATCMLGLPPLGSLFAGEMSRHIPTSHAVAAMAGVAMIAFLGLYVFSPSLRELD